MINRIITAKSVGVSVSGESGRVVVGLVDGLTAYHCRLPLPPLFCAPAKPATVGSGLHAASILCAALPAKEEKRWDERKPRPTQRPHHEPILRYPRTPLVVTIYNRHEERGETRTGFCRLFGFVIGGSGGLALFCLFMVVINRLFLFIVQGFHITMRIAK